MSLMNGLSALGAGVAQFAGTAGIEAQKADLARQSLMLADQLATTRETALQQGQQKFQAGESELTRAQQTQMEQARLATTTSEGALNRAGEMARTQATINAPTPTAKLLRELGVPLPGDTSGTAPSPQAGPRASQAAPTGVTGTSDIMDNPLVAKALGQPMPGSEDYVRRALAKGISTDPEFKDKPTDIQAAELENRLAIAQGKMTDPASRKSMAEGIASYQLAPLSGFAAAKPGGPETMAMVMKINPDYQEARYPEINKAMGAFGSGKQGDIVRSANVGVQHLDVLDQAGEALKNNNLQALNSLKNTFSQQFGSPEPTTFDGLKQIVGTEIEKAVAGGIGSSADRDRIMKALSSANSPAQLKAITDGFRSLMIGQLSGLKTQYEDATGIKTGPFGFSGKLVPATIKALGLHADGTPDTGAPLAPVTGAPASTSLPDPLGIR